MKSMKDYMKEQKSTDSLDEKKVNSNRAATAMQKTVDQIDKLADMITDMQDQDMVSSKDVKKFEKAAGDIRTAIGSMKP